MRCEHHLIQESLAEQPQVPALTPEGFREWMTAMIMACPETEYERLSKAVLDMPISNADDYKERFPKELPRRLFPSHEHLQAQQRCAAALATVKIGPLRRAPTFPPPPPMNQSSSSGVKLERERSPYVNPAQSSRAVDSDDEDDEPLAVPIERERKPYTAAPGGGKVHGESMSQSTHSDGSANEQRRRAYTATSQMHSTQWVPPQRHPRTTSTASRRQRSPSFSSYGHRSDPNVGNIPGSYSTLR